MKKFIYVLFILTILVPAVFTAEPAANEPGTDVQPEEQPAAQPQEKPVKKADTKKAKKTVDLGTIVIGATPYGKSLQDLPYNVDVVTRTELENSGAINVPDALKNSVGVVVQDVGGSFHALQSIRLRGGKTNQTAVTINGIRIMNDLSRGAYLMGFGVNAIENVEIMRGNGVVLFGPNANFGVVNLVTKKAPKGTHYHVGSLYGGGGIKSLMKGWMGTSYGEDTFRIFANVSYMKQDSIVTPEKVGSYGSETIPNSDADFFNSLVTLGFNKKDNSAYVDMMFFSTKGKGGNPGDDATIWTDANFKRTEYFASIKPGFKLGKIAEIIFIGSYSNAHYHDYNPSFSNDDDLNFKMFSLETKGIIKPFKKFIATVGIVKEWDFYEKDASSSANDIPELTESRVGAYLHLDYTISIVQIMAGVRVDDHRSSDETRLQSFGTLFSFQAGVLVSVFKELLKVRLQIAKSNFIPSLLDTTWPGFENTDLVTYKFMNYGFGVESKIGKLLKAKATIYYYRYWDVKSGFPAKSTGKEDAFGFEFDAKVKPLATLNLPVDLTIPVNFWYNQHTNLRTEKELTKDMPKIVFNIGLVAGFKFGLDVGVYARYRENYDTDPASLKDYYLSYFVMDLKINMRFKVNNVKMRAFFNVLNLTNERYSITSASSQYYTMPALSIRGGIEARF